MNRLRIYEIQPAYIDYLSEFAPHLFHNKKAGQNNERKYIGIVLQINGHNYFAPLLASGEFNHYESGENRQF